MAIPLAQVPCNDARTVLLSALCTQPSCSFGIRQRDLVSFQRLEPQDFFVGIITIDRVFRRRGSRSWSVVHRMSQRWRSLRLVGIGYGHARHGPEFRASRAVLALREKFDNGIPMSGNASRCGELRNVRLTTVVIFASLLEGVLPVVSHCAGALRKAYLDR